MKVVAAGERSAPITLGGVARCAPVVVMVGQRGPAGAGGVATFNGRLGSVTLIGADVTTALGYTPQDGGSLSAVAFSGDYADLLGAPAIPSTPADIGAATAAQGALAASAVQPDALDTALADKVDKVAGYGLSQESYTSAEKTKLAGLEGSHFKGLFASLAALELALPSAVAGDYADVDAGVGSDTVRYLWDVDDVQWVASGSGAPLTAADVKSLYESNPDTNAYTDAEQTKLGAIEAGAQVNAAAVSQADAEAGTGTALRSWTVQRVWQAIAAWWAASAMKTKLDGIAAGATANSSDAALLARSNHTGTQAASTIIDFNAAAKAAVPQCIIIACSDETTALSAGVAKVTFRMPFGFTLLEVRASLTTAQASGSILTVDINEDGTSILSTKLTIDNTEKTSKTAATPAVISDAVLADDTEITIDVVQVGDGTAKGLKITLIGA